MTDSLIIALFLVLLPIVALVIAYSVYVFRHGNVNDEDSSQSCHDAGVLLISEPSTAIALLADRETLNTSQNTERTQGDFYEQYIPAADLQYKGDA